MTADPTGFDRLVLAAAGAPTAAPETAGDLAVLEVPPEAAVDDMYALGYADALADVKGLLP